MYNQSETSNCDTTELVVGDIVITTISPYGKVRAVVIYKFPAITSYTWSYVPIEGMDAGFQRAEKSLSVQSDVMIQLEEDSIGMFHGKVFRVASTACRPTNQQEYPKRKISYCARCGWYAVELGIISDKNHSSMFCFCCLKSLK